MTNKDIEKIRLLSAKERCAKKHICIFSEEEKQELDRYKKIFGTLKNGCGKTTMYLRDFMGIDYDSIAIITNYTKKTLWTRYKETLLEFKLSTLGT